MIKVGTLCLVIYTVEDRKEFLGRECVVISYIPKDKNGHDKKVQFNDGLIVLAADKNLLPISPPHEQQSFQSCNKETNHV